MDQLTIRGGKVSGWILHSENTILAASLLLDEERVHQTQIHPLVHKLVLKLVRAVDNCNGSFIVDDQQVDDVQDVYSAINQYYGSYE